MKAQFGLLLALTLMIACPLTRPLWMTALSEPPDPNRIEIDRVPLLERVTLSPDLESTDRIWLYSNDRLVEASLLHSLKRVREGNVDQNRSLPGCYVDRLAARSGAKIANAGNSNACPETEPSSE